jgi:hypothetical protein
MLNKLPLWTILSFGLLLAFAALLLRPSTNQAIIARLGLDRANRPAPAYNGFDAFIPFIPGYFPEEFEITHAETGSRTSSEINTYSETYASDTHFFKTIQSQGANIPEPQLDLNIKIQDQPASLTNIINIAQLFEGDTLDLSRYDTKEIWLLTVVLKEVTIQIATNLPKEEVIRVAEGLIPSICTSTPTPEG